MLYSKEIQLYTYIRSVAQSCPTLCDPMNRSMPGLPVHHQLPEFIETHVHRVSDAIQPSHPLSSPSSPAPNPPSMRVLSNESTLRMRWPKYWSFSLSIIPSQEIPGLISFRMDWLDLLAVQGTLKSLLSGKESTCQCRSYEFNPDLGRSLGRGNDNPSSIQYLFLLHTYHLVFLCCCCCCC